VKPEEKQSEPPHSRHSESSGQWPAAADEVKILKFFYDTQKIFNEPIKTVRLIKIANQKSSIRSLSINQEGNMFAAIDGEVRIAIKSFLT
jgi:hypothetical protein